MNRLTILDLGFLFLEKRNQPLHVAYLNLHTPPADAGPEFGRRLVERLRSYATPLAPFNQRLENRLGAGFWVEDPEFDIDQHVIHLSLPKPGRMQDLLAMVSRMHASHLDRAYPLWRTYVIEGVDGNRIATYSKVHHSVADGVAGTRLMLKSMSSDPEEIIAPTWALPPRGRREPGGLLGPVSRLAKLAGSAKGALQSVPGVARELRAAYREQQERNMDFVSGFSAPRSCLNVPISASRRFVARSFPLVRAKSAAKALGCTVNDAVLSMCSHALRRYLLEQNALPDRPLIAAVPVSTRRDHSDSGNQVVFLLANLGTHLSDPADRLQAIRGSVENSKRRYQRMTPEEIFAFNAALMVPGCLNMVLNPHAKWLAFNLVISNVPGPKAQMYWQGCTLDGMFPVSAIVDGMALNITLTSRQDALDFGVIACRRTLPYVERLLEYLGEGLDEFERLAGVVSEEGGGRVRKLRRV